MIRLSLPCFEGFCSTKMWAGMGRVVGGPWSVTGAANIWPPKLVSSTPHPWFMMMFTITFCFLNFEFVEVQKNLNFEFVEVQKTWNLNLLRSKRTKNPHIQQLAFLRCSSSCCFTRSACARRMARASRLKRCMVLVCRYLPSLVAKIAKICPGLSQVIGVPLFIIPFIRENPSKIWMIYIGVSPFVETSRICQRRIDNRNIRG